MAKADNGLKILLDIDKIMNSEELTVLKKVTLASALVKESIEFNKEKKT